MAYFILVLKGFIIGLAKIIPGVSGAVIAISFNVYDECIKTLNNLLNFKKTNIKILLFLSLGFIISIIFGSKAISFFIKKYYLEVMLLFIGLIIGGLPNLLNKINIKKKKNIFYLSLAVIIILFFNFLNFNSINKLGNSVTFLLLGVIESFTTIIPGISGTAIYMMLGYYDEVLNLFSFTNVNIMKYLYFIIGIIIGLIICIKVINYVFKKYEEQTYSLIIGFVISSVIVLFINTLKYNYSLKEIFIGLFLLFIGYKIGYKLDR